MSQLMRFDFRLFGPRRDQTIIINGHPFVNGLCSIGQSSQNLAACVRVLGFYGAYHRGSSEYDAAVAKEEAEDAAKGVVSNGTDEAVSETLEGAEAPVWGGVRSVGEGSSAPAADDRGAAVETDGSGSAGGDAHGDGHEHAGLPVFPEDANHRITEPASEVDEAVKLAILKLDPQNEDHWVRTGAAKGKPRLQIVEEAYGKAGLTRQDLEAALPSWTRDTALEAALAAA